MSGKGYEQKIRAKSHHDAAEAYLERLIEEGETIQVGDRVAVSLYNIFTTKEYSVRKIKITAICDEV